VEEANAMPLIFNSVTQFIEAIGRRTVKDKRNTLDRIDCIFTGDSAGALDFLPANGTPHPSFPLMYCEKAQIVTEAALMAEVRVSYIGKLIGSPSGIYRTTPDINRSRHLGSVSYSTTQSIATWLLSNTSWVVRFTAKGVSFRYLTNEVLPSDFDGYFAVQAEPYLGVENVQSFRAGLSYAAGGPASGFVQATLVYNNELVDLSVQDLDNGWYDVTESYITQAYADTVIVGVPYLGGDAPTSPVLQYPNADGTGWAS
jgi:hypothetical protein